MSNVIALRPYAPSRALRALARERHIEAVEALIAGNRDAWLTGLRDVELLSDEARRAEDWEAEAERARQERRATARALEWLLERAGR